MSDKVLIYQGENGLVVHIPVSSVELDEDTDMLSFNYTVEEGTAPPHDELGPILGKYISDLIDKYVEEVIEARTE